MGLCVFDTLSHDKQFLASGCNPLTSMPCQCAVCRAACDTLIQKIGALCRQPILRFHAPGDIVISSQCGNPVTACMKRERGFDVEAICSGGYVSCDNTRGGFHWGHKWSGIQRAWI